MLLIDSDVFIIDRRYRKDAKYRTNKNFLDFVHEEEKYTTIFNLLVQRIVNPASNIGNIKNPHVRSKSYENNDKMIN